MRSWSRPSLRQSRAIRECLEELKLVAKIMPCNVSTRWNSTYDMLSFAIEYREAIESMTADRKSDLRKFELAEEEWVIAEEVRDTLKACNMAPRHDNTIS